MVKGRTVSATTPVSATRTSEEARCQALARAFPDDFIATLLTLDPASRAKHVRLLRFLLCLTVALTASVLVNAYQATRPPRLIGLSSMPVKDGNKLLTTMSEPINTEAQVRTWVTNAVVQAYTFDFASWNNQLGRSRQNFTPDGWDGFHVAVKDSGVLQAVIDSKFKVSAVPNGPTVMATLPAESGRRSWKFEVPIVVTYEGPSAKPSTSLIVSVVIVPQPPWEQERGLGIASMSLAGGLTGGK